MATYGDIVSEMILSESMVKDASSVAAVGDIKPDLHIDRISGTLNITGSSLVKEIRIHALDGRLVKVFTAVGSVNDISELPEGVYIVTALCTDGSTVTRKTTR